MLTNECNKCILRASNRTTCTHLVHVQLNENQSSLSERMIRKRFNQGRIQGAHPSPLPTLKFEKKSDFFCVKS